jgi:hypothetical protein
MTRSTTFLGSLLVAALFGCSGGADVSLVEVLNHDQCRISQAGAELVGIEDVARIRGGRLLSAPDEPATKPTDLLLVAVSRGQQPTPGYGFELVGGTIKGDAVTVRLAWNQPPADAVLAQVITHPCIVIGLEGAGFSKLRVIDQDDAPLGEIVLPGG